MRRTYTVLLLSALFADASCRLRGRDDRRQSLERQNQRAQQQRQQRPSPPSSNGTTTFPPYDTTLELLTLSSIIYKYRGLSSCAEVVLPNATHPLPPRSTCHLFERDRQDTQVMVVSRPISPDPGHDGYVAVVYAGTDDFRNVLTDGDVFFKPFGPSGGNGTYPYVPPSYPDAMVHAGFDHAVFHDGLFERVLSTVRSVLSDHPTYRLLTTGHSLGAADSVLTSVALSQRLGPNRPILCVNFGCPRTGNRQWRDYVNSLSPSVSVWRFVNSVDIVPRLPDGRFVHAGHTVQMSAKGCRAYYRHDGDVDLGYRGVPLGWEVAPFVIVPYNGICHFVRRYLAYLIDKAGLDRETYYVREFARIGESDDDDAVPDDDDVPDPPDDDLRFDHDDALEDGGASDAYGPKIRAEIAGDVLDWYAEMVRDGEANFMGEDEFTSESFGLLVESVA